MEKAIFSAVVALLLFALTQVFIHLRDRQTFLRTKLEELFDAMNALSEAIVDSYHHGQVFESDGDSTALAGKLRDINKALYRPRTLVLLYFPYMKKPWEDLVVTSTRGHIKYFNEVISGSEKFDSDLAYKAIQKMSLEIRALQNFLSDNVAFTTQSIRFHLKSMFTRKIHIQINT